VAVELAVELKMKKIAVIGASGYSGEVLVRLLLNHPQAELVAPRRLAMLWEANEDHSCCS
jgi:N-acetyl-gamma-glutamylphosphate reductase